MRPPGSPPAQPSGHPRPAKARRARAASGRASQPAGLGLVASAWRRSRLGIGTVLLLTAFINITKVAIPLYIFQLLDRVIASRNVDTLVLLTGMVLVTVLFAAGADLLRRWMMLTWGQWIEQHFGRHLFVDGLGQQRARGPGRAIEELADVSHFVSGSGLTSWLDAMWSPAFLVIVYLIHPSLGLIVLAGMLAMLVLGVTSEIAVRPMRSALRRARRRSEAVVATADRNSETIVGLNIGERLADRWSRRISRQNRDGLAARLTGASVGEAMRLTEAMQRVGCYGLGVWLAVADELSVGAIIAAAVLGRLGTSAVRRAMSNWRLLVLAVRSYRRIGRRLGVAAGAAMPLRDPEAPMALRLDHVTHAHAAGSPPLFRALDLTVAPGEILCVLGPSGSGKTTLARLMAGVVAPTQGSVQLGGLAIARFPGAERQALLGYLPQDTMLVAGTIAENIASLGRASDGDIVNAAKLAGIHEVIQRLPNGYETRLDGHGTTLSGGEIRRLGIARALFGRKRLIVLDEPEANLDADLVALLLDALRRCRDAGMVVVVTSQAAEFARIADKVIMLRRNARPDVLATRDAFSAREAAGAAGAGGPFALAPAGPEARR